MAASAGSGTRGVRLDSEERRRQILQAATGLFLQRPYSDVSITDIAEAAGVARGLLHHYFDSKRALYLEVVRNVSRASTTEAVPRQLAKPDAGDPGWNAAIDALLEFVQANRQVWVTSARLGGTEGDDELSSIVDEGREVVADQLITGLGLRDRDTPELRAVVRGYGGLVQEVTLEWIERGRLTREQARTVLVRALPLLLSDVLPAISPAHDVRP